MSKLDKPKITFLLIGIVISALSGAFIGYLTITVDGRWFLALIPLGIAHWILGEWAAEQDFKRQ